MNRRLMIMNTSSRKPAAERCLSLHGSRVQRLHGAVHLRVTHGTVWLTVTGHTDDHVLQPGDSFALPRGGEGLVEAVSGNARIVIAQQALSWAQGAAAKWRAVARRFAEVLA